MMDTLSIFAPIPSNLKRCIIVNVNASSSLHKRKGVAGIVRSFVHSLSYFSCGALRSYSKTKAFNLPNEQSIFFRIYCLIIIIRSIHGFSLVVGFWLMLLLLAAGICVARKVESLHTALRVNFCRRIVPAAVR